MGPKDTILTCISLLALVLSITSLWLNYLKPFRAKIIAGDPTFFFVPIKLLTGTTRWIPAIDVQLSFYNLGKIAGTVYDVRMRFQQTNEQINSFTLHAEHVVDFSKFVLMRVDRDNWKSAITRQWSPTLLMPTSGTTVHIILEGVGLDEKVEGLHTLILEVYTSERNKWVALKTFNVQMWANMYGGATFTLADRKLLKIRGEAE